MAVADKLMQLPSQIVQVIPAVHILKKAVVVEGQGGSDGYDLRLRLPDDAMDGKGSLAEHLSEQCSGTSSVDTAEGFGRAVRGCRKDDVVVLVG